ncbi:MAG: DASS family sodium-coupled anion symporter [Lewinella sp.]|nr:DASS family sodium-coupled anion symporter [Lewinella sp.]
MQQIQWVVAYQTHFIYFLLSVIGAFVLTYTLRSPEFTQAQDYVLFLLFFSVGLWVTEAIPPFAVGILIVGFLVFFLGSIDQSGATTGAEKGLNVVKFVSTWSNSVIWLILGGFFLAEGMRKSGVDRDVFRLLLSRFKPTPSRILLSVMLATCLASMLMSNTATTAMMVATTAPIIGRLGDGHPLGKAILLGIPIAAALGGMGTIIGSPPNAIAVEAINNSGALSFNIGFLEWMMFGLPLALVLTFILWNGLLRKYPTSENIVDIADLLEKPEKAQPVTLGDEENGEQQIRLPDSGRLSKRIVIITLLVTLGLWLTGRLHGIPPAAVSGIPIIVFTMVSIITGDDVRSLPWDTLMLVAGGLALGLAIQETGLSDYFVEQLQRWAVSPILLLPLFALVTVVLSNIMSNTATATILIPIAAIWPGMHPAVLPLVIGLAASCALFLPVSTPPNAIVYATGKVSQNEFRFGGTVVGLIGPLFIILWVSVMRMVLGF